MYSVLFRLRAVEKEARYRNNPISICGTFHCVLNAARYFRQLAPHVSGKSQKQNRLKRCEQMVKFYGLLQARQQSPFSVLVVRLI